MVWVMGLAVLILVVYYVFVSRTVLQLAHSDANTALLMFALLALIPPLPFLIMGIVLMIICPIRYRLSQVAVRSPWPE